jgi:hypothetical protein
MQISNFCQTLKIIRITQKADFVRMVLHRPRVCSHYHVRLDVHRGPFPTQSHHSDGLQAGYLSQTLPGTRLGNSHHLDGNLGRIHRNSTDHFRVSTAVTTRAKQKNETNDDDNKTKMI